VALYDRTLDAVTPGQTEVALGDLLVGVETLRAWRGRLAGGPQPRSATATGIALWPEGRVYYAFDGTVSTAERAAFVAAMAEWVLFADLQFIERTMEPDYLNVREQDLDPEIGGQASLGVRGGPQTFDIAPAGWGRDILVHELGHSLGLIHEHQRRDRDEFVTILAANVRPDLFAANFLLVPESLDHGDYDLLSTMHYTRSAFSVAPATLNAIEPKPAFAQFLDLMGQSVYLLSPGDRAGIAALYGPPDRPPLSTVVTHSGDGGVGSLRAAIYQAQDEALADPASRPAITFRMPTDDPGFSGGVFTIRPTGRLPGLGPRTTLDGATQAAFTGDTNPVGPEIWLDGSSLTDAKAMGLFLTQSECAVRNLVIGGFPAQGIALYSPQCHGGSIQGCHIGTDASGTVAHPNRYSGIALWRGASGNLIGGTAAGAGSVCSGNNEAGILIGGSGTSGNRVQGNLCGLDITGALAMPNGWSGINIGHAATGNTVGGAAAGAGNVCSGNAQAGISVADAGTNRNVVQGSLCGLNRAGTVRVPNGFSGVALWGGACENLIGGAAAGEGNVLSGNTENGVLIADSGTTGKMVLGNVIGLAADGSTACGNSQYGVLIQNGAADNTIGGVASGAGDRIACNTRHGIQCGGSSTGNTLRGNRISGNGRLGINLDTWDTDELLSGVTPNDLDDTDSGPNQAQNFPILTLAKRSGSTLTVQGTLNSEADRTYAVDLFGSSGADPSGYGEGEQFLGFTSVTTTGNSGAFAAVLHVDDWWPIITATATSSDGNTSEFSPAFACAPDTDNDGDGLPDGWETEYLGDLTQTSVGDYDGDGESNGYEYAHDTDPADARSTHDPDRVYRDFVFMIRREFLQTGGKGLVEDRWGVVLECHVPGGSVFQAGSLTKPTASVGQNPAARIGGESADVGSFERADYASLEALMADLAPGQYRVVCWFAAGGGEAQPLRFRVDVPGYDGSAFPAPVMVEQPAPGANGVSTSPLLDFDRADWYRLDIRAAGDGPVAYGHPRAAGETDTHQPSGAVLLPAAQYELVVVAWGSAASLLATWTRSGFTTAPLPAVNAFAVDAGAPSARQRTVLLTNACSGNPSSHMASERPDLGGATPEAYDPAPLFVLSAGDGLKTVYFQVRNEAGPSAVVSDTIALDQTAPTVVDVTSPLPDGVYGVGASVEVTVGFSEPVTVVGTPRLALETGVTDALADCTGGSGMATLTFHYVVREGDTSLDLDYVGTEALALNGGAIRDAAGNDAVLALPAPGTPHSLSANRAIAVGSVHTVVYSAGAHGHISGTTLQTVVYGGNGSAVAAVADHGYVFTHWNDGVLTASRTDANVTADATYTASFRAATAVSPSGSFLAVTGASAVATAGFWDLSGTHVFDVIGNPLVLNVVHDTKGKLTGTATYTVAKASIVTMAVKGTVKGANGSVTMRGSMKGASPDRAVSVALALDLTVDTANRRLTGPLTGTVKAGGVTTPVDEALCLDIPSPMDGTWALAFDLAQSGTAVTGTARLTLSNGAGHDVTVKGKTGANSTAVLGLAGDKADPAAKAIKIKATITPLEGGWARLEAFTGKGYGQTVAW